MLTLVNIQVMEKAGHPLPCPCFAAHGESRLMKSMSFCLVPVRLAGRAARRGAFLSPRWERNQRIARGTFRKVPRGPSSRPRGKPRGGFPHWIPLPGTKGRNREAPGKAEALTGRGGAIERMQAFAAITVTADAQPVRFATTKVPFGAFSFPDFFLAGEKKSGCRRLAFKTSAEAIYDSALGRGRSPRGVPFPAMGKEPKDRPGHLPKGSPGPLLPAKGKTARRFPPLDPPSGDERQKR